MSRPAPSPTALSSGNQKTYALLQNVTSHLPPRQQGSTRCLPYSEAYFAIACSPSQPHPPSGPASITPSVPRARRSPYRYPYVLLSLSDHPRPATLNTPLGPDRVANVRMSNEPKSARRRMNTHEEKVQPVALAARAKPRIVWTNAFHESLRPEERMLKRAPSNQGPSKASSVARSTEDSRIPRA